MVTNQVPCGAPEIHHSHWHGVVVCPGVGRANAVPRKSRRSALVTSHLWIEAAYPLRTVTVEPTTAPEGWPVVEPKEWLG